MEATPLALPVTSLMLVAFLLTSMLTAVEAYIAHAFYGALRSQHELNGYEPLPPRPTYGSTRTREHNRAALDSNLKLGSLYETLGGVGAGMQIDSFVQGMQNRMESGKHSSLGVPSH